MQKYGEVTVPLFFGAVLVFWANMPVFSLDHIHASWDTAETLDKTTVVGLNEYIMGK